MELGIVVFKRIKILSSNFYVDLYFMAFQEGFTKLWTGLDPNVAIIRHSEPLLFELIGFASQANLQHSH